jgi:hypothetical protein
VGDLSVLQVTFRTAVMAAPSPSTSQGTGGGLGAPTQYCLTAVAVIVAIVAFASWASHSSKLQNAKNRADQMHHLELQKFDMRVLENLYRRAGQAAPVRTISSSLHEDDYDVLVSIRRLKAGGFVGVKDLSKDVDAATYVPEMGDSVKLTEGGSSQFMRPSGDVVHGDMIIGGERSIITNRSIVINSFTDLSARYDPETVQALAELERVVRTSHNQDGIEQLENFLEEVKSTSPKRSVLRALFNGMMEAVPAITKLATLTETITRLFT